MLSAKIEMKKHNGVTRRTFCAAGAEFIGAGSRGRAFAQSAQETYRMIAAVDRQRILRAAQLYAAPLYVNAPIGDDHGVSLPVSER